jgi:hypothetical protein
MQIVGVVGSVQFLASRLLFAEDRQKTLDDVKYLIREKIDAGTAGDDMRKLAETVCTQSHLNMQHVICDIELRVSALGFGIVMLLHIVSSLSLHICGAQVKSWGIVYCACFQVGAVSGTVVLILPAPLGVLKLKPFLGAAKSPTSLSAFKCPKQIL